MTRTGIFLCTCEDRVNKAVDVNAVAQELRTAHDLDVSVVPHVCLPDGISALRQTILDHHLEHVVVAACPARFQAKRLRAASAGAGVNSGHFALVDWREGCANVHRGDKENATRKARDLVEMGIAVVSHAGPGGEVRKPIVQRALVVGGGIAGMTAALTLAQRGVSVVLAEQQAMLGGQLRGVSLNGSTERYEQTRRAVLSDRKIVLYLASSITAITGEVGNYHIALAYPNGSTALNVGAIVLATGVQEFNDPHLYRHDGRCVVTLGEFGQLLQDASVPEANSIVYLLCAGSREAEHPYCSKVCCLGALHQAIQVKHARPETRITVLFRDLYLLGDEWNEQVVRQARQLGIEFLRYVPSDPPRVDDDAVIVRDGLTGLVRRVEYDRVVLATPLVPRDDAGVLARWLHLPRDENGFFIDPHYRVRPEEQVERGIFICGSAHRPVDFDTAVLEGQTAAARAGRFLQHRLLTRPAASAMINPDLCTGCAQCVETCAFGAIEMTCPPSSPTGAESTPRAQIDPFLCLACGNCVVACPSKAIDLATARDAQIFAQIDAALGKPRTDASGAPINQKPVSLVFGCAWSGYAAMELAGARRIQYSASVRVIELPCSARLDPLHVLYALLNGAEHVLLALCPPDECHYGQGNRYAERRLENLRAQLIQHGLDPRRVTCARMMGDDVGAWDRTIKEIIE